MVDETQLETTLDGVDGAETQVTEQVDVTQQGSDGGNFVEVDGERYERGKVKEAFQALKSKSGWERANKQRDQKFGRVHRAIETAFQGKRLDELDDNDLNDVLAFGVFNQKLRSDPKFAEAWEAALTAAYKGKGLTTTQAREAAKETVDEAKAGNQPTEQPVAKLPPEVEERMARMDRIESVVVQREVEGLQRRINGTIKAALDHFAKDDARIHPLVRREVLFRLLRVGDEKLFEMDQAGTLRRAVANQVKVVSEQMKKVLDGTIKAKGDAIAAGKAGAQPVIKGGLPGGKPAATAEPRAGRGLKGMSDRFFKDMAAAKE